jgi:hypothetical protein
MSHGGRSADRPVSAEDARHVERKHAQATDYARGRRRAAADVAEPLLG